MCWGRVSIEQKPHLTPKGEGHQLVVLIRPVKLGDKRLNISKDQQSKQRTPKQSPTYDLRLTAGRGQDRGWVGVLPEWPVPQTPHLSLGRVGGT